MQIVIIVMRALISIHALLAESDQVNRNVANGERKFLSTLSLRRATRRHRADDGSPINFYPRSPCGERRQTNLPGKIIKNFYPRSPCGERLGTLRTVSVKKTFLSTLSLRRATSQQPAGTTSTTYFYPRSPCGERLKFSISGSVNQYFYPRSPCGERQYQILDDMSGATFLSTLSLRRATYPTKSRRQS